MVMIILYKGKKCHKCVTLIRCMKDDDDDNDDDQV